MEQELNHAYDLIAERLISWYELAIKGLPNFLVAVLTVIFFYFVARTVSKGVRHLFERSFQNQALANLSETSTRFVINLLGLFIALGILHLDKTVTSLLAGAGVIGLALGFAFQEIASNFVSGILIAVRQPYRVNDIIEVDGLMGYVRLVDLRTTLIETFQGIEIYIPNKFMITKPLKNISGTPRRRLDVEIGVSYGDDLRKVQNILEGGMDEIEGLIESEPIQVRFKEFGNSSIVCDLRVWVNLSSPLDFFDVQHEVILKVKQLFNENNITIPFPIRTLDFGIKGGQNLRVPLSETFGQHPDA